MNSRMNIRSSISSKVISRGTLKSLVHVGWITGINGLAGFGFGFGCPPMVFKVDGPGDTVGFFDPAVVSAGAFARLRSCP